MINNARLLKLIRKLVSIDSQNPPGDESAIAGFVAGYLQRLGLRVRTYEFAKNRANVVSVLKGSGRRSLLITPHLDTVPAGRSWTVPPFKGVVKAGRLYGLGATDCKSNLACAMEALNSIVEDGVRPGYDLIFAATADEESGSELGLIPLLEKRVLKPDAALVLDADDFDIITTQKGLIHIKVKIKGRKAHGAYPWRGVNAIDTAVSLIKGIKSHKFRYKKNKYLRPPTVNVGTIKGGDKVNVVADWCELELDLRFLPGTKGRDLMRQIKNIIRRHAPHSTVETEGIQEPYSIRDDHPLVCGLRDSARRFKVDSRIKGSEGATVITFFQHKGIPAVATGYGSGSCAHMADEYVKPRDLYKGALVLEDFLKSYRFK